MKTTTTIRGCDRRTSRPVTAGRLTSTELIERIDGCTYRQIDWWVRQGLLHPSVKARGSGTRRVFPESEVAVAKVLVKLSHTLSQLGIHETYQAVASAARAGDTGATVGDLYISWRKP